MAPATAQSAEAAKSEAAPGTAYTNVNHGEVTARRNLPGFFHANLLRIAGDVTSVIKGSIELWRTLVEIGDLVSGRFDRHVTRRRATAQILARLSPEIPVERFDSAAETLAIVAGAENFDHKLARHQCDCRISRE